MEFNLADWIQLGALGVLALVLFMIFRFGVPKIFDLITAQQHIFTQSLDKITERHEASMEKVAESMNGVREELSNVRESVAACPKKDRKGQ